MDFDSERIFYSDQSLRAPPPKFSDPFAPIPAADENGDPNSAAEEAANRKYEQEKMLRTNTISANGEIEYSLSTVQRNFKEFIRNYQTNSVFIYRDALLQSVRRGKNCLSISLSHLNEYDPMLLSLVMETPTSVMPVFEAGALDALKTFQLTSPTSLDDPDSEAPQLTVLPTDIHITLSAPHLKPVDLRKITSTHVNKLIKTPGIVISATRIRSKARQVEIMCKGCSAHKKLKITDPYGTVKLPGRCPEGGAEADCGMSPYMVMPDECVYTDTQSLKLQEAPEMVPTGEMPRNILLAVDRNLVDKAKPGMRVSIIGIASLYRQNTGRKSQNNNVKQLYINVVGIQFENLGEGGGVGNTSFTPKEEEAFIALSRRRDIYQILTNSIAPSIQGDYTKDIKKAIACQLMGGAAKKLPDGMRLRGDINLLLLGDPSTAKSQFLKFVEKVAPVGVYTSGKGSSAAGLTASVIKDSRGEFYLEGGAMVLADGGIVCIDEFDKMRPADRVAIHEAMEQQTISIAKAGITTVLNSRTSVLAAANPIFGRYDDLRSAGENIDLMTTILSRFDLIFIVRDIRDEERDKAICRHVMGVHINAGDAAAGNDNQEEDDDDETVAEKAGRVAEQGGKLDIKTFKKFVQYVRSRCSPRLSEEASEVLASQYVKIRDDVRKRCSENGGDTAQVVPITVRQLEALVRLSESLAKMRLAAEVAAEDIAEALRLFRVATMAASETDSNNGQDLLAAANGPNRDDYEKAEKFLQSRVAIGTTVNKQRLVEEAVGMGQNANIIARVLRVFCKKGEFLEKSSGRTLKRVK
ncbi:hypothetical protein TL16_g10888 [Triparma laevis f. inornata]|uniref:DNA replication licensing factor MCM5 n=1 Tax=Triparma laevis f. inornata TaxID=1714386 RepID=A0A9W7ERV8_9STRA|nr:hypothetical protein TL16_g10888 [Triparma laevis f. inornata]